MAATAAVTCLGGLASGAIVADNFESYALTPTTQNLGSPWGSTGYQSNQNTRVVAEQSAFGAAGDSKGFQLYDASTTGSPYAERSLAGLTTSDDVEIQFDFISHGTPSAGGSTSSQFMVMSGSTAGLIFRFDADGNIAYSNSSGTQVNLEPLVRNEWYRAKLSLLPASTGADKWQLTLQRFGQAATSYGVGHTLSFRNNISSFTHMRISNNSSSATAQFVIDNVIVDVPEPSSALACVAAMALIGRRRRAI